jgi:hypothetical protein
MEVRVCMNKIEYICVFFSLLKDYKMISTKFNEISHFLLLFSLVFFFFLIITISLTLYDTVTVFYCARRKCRRHWYIMSLV